MLISFEGCDGAGKSSHVPWLAERLREQGIDPVLTREPGGTPLGEKIRTLLLNDPMALETEVLLMFASRRQLLTNVIEPALAKGLVVITDRFVDSSYAFQGGGRELGAARIKQLDDWCGGPRPNLTFLFDLPVEVARARIGDRQLDRFEQEAQAFHQRVRDAYLARAAAEPNRFVVLDATKTIEELRRQLLDILRAIGLLLA